MTSSKRNNQNSDDEIIIFVIIFAVLIFSGLCIICPELFFLFIGVLVLLTPVLIIGGYFVKILLDSESVPKVSIPQVSIEEIDNMSGYEFESFIGKLYKTLGYSVKQTSLSGDQGADLILSKSGEKIAVQTKRYGNNVSNKAIQEVVASKAMYNCTKCMVVTNSYFTQSALKLAQANNVELIDRDKLIRLIRKNLHGNSLKNSARSYYTTAESDKKADFLNISNSTVPSMSSWKEITRIKGNCIKNTETFHIPSNEWKISWNTTPGEHGDTHFSIYIYSSDNSLAGLAGNVTGKNSDYSMMRGSGNYYLTINSSQEYEIVIESRAKN